MLNNASTIITKEFILARVPEEEIFKRYLGLEPSVTGSFINPLRTNDGSPGCGFYVDSRGYWKFHDHAAGFNWDCFNVIEYDYGCSFKEALLKVAVDFNLISGEQSQRVFTKSVKTRIITELRIQRRSWLKRDYEVWAQYHIQPERLDFFQVHPIQNAWFVTNGIMRLCYGYKYDDPCFAYHFGNYEYKLHFPLRQERSKRHIHVNSKILQGWNQLPDEAENLLITKSYKDVMCVDIFSNEFDLYSLAPMAETIVMPPEVFSILYNRFDNIGTLFDFDRAGIKLMRKYEKDYKLPYYFFAKEFKGSTFGKTSTKDFSDYVKVKGLDDTRRLIERFLKKKDYGREEVF